MYFFIIFSFLNVRSFILDKTNYTMINEKNKYINNYSVDTKTINFIKCNKNIFKQNYLPIALHLSSKHLAKIFKFVFDFITNENFFEIDKIFNIDVLDIQEFDKIAILLKQFSYKNDVSCKKDEIIFNKSLLFLKYNEILNYVFNVEFIKKLDLTKFSEYSEYISNLSFLKKFNSKIIFLEHNDKNIQMSLPEYFILGLYCFLNGHYDEITNRSCTSKNICL